MSAGRTFSRQIPAAVGYFFLRPVTDATGYPVSFKADSIVAWAFEDGDARVIPYPVTFKGVQTDNLAIREPRCLVHSETEDELDPSSWLTYVQAQYLRQGKKGGSK